MSVVQSNLQNCVRPRGIAKQLTVLELILYIYGIPNHQSKLGMEKKISINSIFYWGYQIIYIYRYIYIIYIYDYII